MLHRSALLLALLGVGLGLTSGSAAAAASRSEARAFTKATLAFDLARGRAVGRAERIGDERRRTAAACSETLRTAPAGRRDELFRLYFAYVSAGYFREDEPIFARWVSALKRISTSDATLRQARTSIARQLTTARRLYGQGRRFCSLVEAWGQAGWSTAATPTPVRRLAELAAGADSPRLTAGINAAARALRSRGGVGSQLAASVLQEGIDEPDELVIERDDPIVELLT